MSFSHIREFIIVHKYMQIYAHILRDSMSTGQYKIDWGVFLITIGIQSRSYQKCLLMYRIHNAGISTLNS